MMYGSIRFPNPYAVGSCEILQIGGSLTADNLLKAYSMGIFPWYCEEDPVLWWCPVIRHIIFTENFRVPGSIRRNIKKKNYTCTFNKDFETVINKCAKVERGPESGTWITRDMIQGYTDLHRKGYAFSVETWKNGAIVGGLYGVQLGKYISGESMFHEDDNASDAALVKLWSYMKEKNLPFLDCQVTSDHIFRFGAEEISREYFLNLHYGLINK